MKTKVSNIDSEILETALAASRSNDECSLSLDRDSLEALLPEKEEDRGKWQGIIHDLLLGHTGEDGYDGQAAVVLFDSKIIFT